MGIHRLQKNGVAVSLLGDPDGTLFKSILYVRQTSVELRGHIRQVMQSSARDGVITRKRFAVTGTPGIGKSSFSNYFAAMVLREGKTVFYQFKEEYGVVLEPGKNGQPPVAIEYGLSDFRAFQDIARRANAESGWYVIDSATPVVSKVPALLVTSTQPRFYNEWLKQGGGDPFYMPLPEVEEIRKLRDVVCPSMSKDEFTERYELVGRSFRYVVDDRTPLGDVKARIDEALSSVDLSALEADMHSPSTDKKLTSRVVYIDVGSGPDGKIRFSMPIFRFATGWVEQEVMNRAFEGNLVALWRAVDSRRFWMGNEVEWGLRFESTALKMLTKRTRLRMVQLFPNGTRGASFDVQTPCAPGCVQQRFDDLLLDVPRAPQNAPILWCPADRTFPAVDAIYLGPTASGAFLVQCTVSDAKRRDLVGQKALKLLGELAKLWSSRYGNERMRLIYLVPSDKFNMGAFRYPNVDSAYSDKLEVYVALLLVDPNA